MGACAADYDNDGWIDLYVTNVGPNVLYRNNGGKTFTDVTRSAGVGSSSFSASCAFADIDRDGDVDLFVTNYVDARVDNNIFCGDTVNSSASTATRSTSRRSRIILYRNNGDGTFTDVSRQAGIDGHRGNGLGAVFGDYDDDGWLDLFVANDTTPNFLYHNEGDGTFSGSGTPRRRLGGQRRQAARRHGHRLRRLRRRRPASISFVTNHELEAHTLFRNLGKGLFDDATFPSGIGPATLPYVGFGAAFLDYDNDGDLDLADRQRPRDEQPGPLQARRDRGAAEAAASERRPRKVQGGRPALGSRLRGREGRPGSGRGRHRQRRRSGSARHQQRWRRRSPAQRGRARQHALLLRLTGTRSNRSASARGSGSPPAAASGARDKSRLELPRQQDLRVHFGLGRATRIDRLEIRWPSGTTEVVADAAINQILTVVEGKGVIGRVPFVRAR